MIHLVSTLALAACVGDHVGGLSRDDLLDSLCAKHNAAVAGIQTLHCRVVISGNNTPKFSGIEYWRSGTDFRLDVGYDTDVYRYVSRNGILRYTMRQDIALTPYMRSVAEVRESLEGSDHYWHGGVCVASETAICYNPMLTAGFIWSLGTPRGYCSFPDFLRDPSQQVEDVRKTDDGMYRITVRTGSIRNTYWLDPTVNYLIRKSRHESGSTPPKVSESEVLSFHEPAPGVFFPHVHVHKSHREAKPVPDTVTTFSDVQVNRPIPDSVFRLTYRRGIYIDDRIEGKKYKVDENGTPMGAKTPLVVPVMPPTPEALLDTPVTETTEEPARWGWWVLPSALAFLGVAGMLVYVRRRRAAAA